MIKTTAMVVLFLAGCGSGIKSGDSAEHDASSVADAAGNPDADPHVPVEGMTALEDENADPDVVEVHLVAQVGEVSLGDGVELEMWTYNGTLPGPLIQARTGNRVIVHFTNELPEETTIHWHGLRISDQMDGNPRIQSPVQPGESFTYDFVVPDAGSFWYHPHVRANEQVERGLYGGFIVRDDRDPTYESERYLALDDILLDQGRIPAFLASGHEMVHGRSGNALLTNGQFNELAVVSVEQGTVERLRLVNPANARTMELAILGASARVIGSDGGLLPEPYAFERILLSPGQRYDVEVTYDTTGEASLQSYVLELEGEEVVEVAVPVFVANVAASARKPSTIEWPEITLPDREPTEEVELRFNADTSGDTLVWMINENRHENGHDEAHQVLFSHPAGTTMRMRLVNQAGPEHPFHLHGQFFQIVPNGQPWTEQPGLKDTVLVPGLETVEAIVYLDNPGEWMAHCHILEHAELGMMAEFEVAPEPSEHEGHE